MHELNSMEEQLGSWTPRRPSRGLEGRLFGHLSTVEPSLMHLRVGWMVPATALLVVVLQILVVGRPGTPRSDRWLNAATNVGRGAADASWSAYASSALHSGQNSPISDTFEWTNLAVAPSTRRAFPGMLSMTNSLFD